MNKKLLKSVATLFAVAVLGVSCSSPADGGNDGNGGNGGKQTEITKANLIAAVNSISYTFTEPAADTRAEGDRITWAFTGKMNSTTTLGQALAVKGTLSGSDVPAGTLAEIKKANDANNPFITAVIKALGNAGFATVATDVVISGTASSQRQPNSDPVIFTIKVKGLKKVKNTHKLSTDLSTFLANNNEADALVLHLEPANTKTWK